MAGPLRFRPNGLPFRPAVLPAPFLEPIVIRAWSLVVGAMLPGRIPLGDPFRVLGRIRLPNLMFPLLSTLVIRRLVGRRFRRKNRMVVWGRNLKLCLIVSIRKQVSCPALLSNRRPLTPIVRLVLKVVPRLGSIPML